jgi:hypothetical protein
LVTKKQRSGAAAWLPWLKFCLVVDKFFIDAGTCNIWRRVHHKDAAWLERYFGFMDLILLTLFTCHNIQQILEGVNMFTILVTIPPKKSQLKICRHLSTDSIFSYQSTNAKCHRYIEEII